ncbi:MAG TPA: SRPBCC domain-containing protein [Solirubrobacteraceae bacterium]|nr:SRPBCC domain-containing protein [Solirubrobacteraceae bacterium]
MTTTARELTITREFDAPRAVVWEAITAAEQVAEWFGPEGFGTEGVEIDLRVGGRYDLTMLAGDARHPVHYEIAELDPPHLLVLTSPPMPEIGIHEMTTTRIELSEAGGRTSMRLTDGPYVDATHAEAGWRGALAKLEALLAAH